MEVGALEYWNSGFAKASFLDRINRIDRIRKIKNPVYPVHPV
jgi:hypothetical protein